MVIGYSVLPQRDLLERLRSDATSFLLNAVPYGSYVGIVTFGSTAQTLHPVSLVENAEDIDSLIDALPDQAVGRTCVGCAMELALQVGSVWPVVRVPRRGTRAECCLTLLHILKKPSALFYQPARSV